MRKQTNVLWKVLATMLILGFAALTLAGCEGLLPPEEKPEPTKKGTFSYTITWPDNVTAEITLQKLPEMTEISLVSVNTATASGKIKTLSEKKELDEGNYLFHVYVSNDDSDAEVIQQIQVTSGKDTTFVKTITSEDLHPKNIGGAVSITSVEVIVIAPVKDAPPVSTATGGDNFTIIAVSWSPFNDKFLGGATYTVTVLLSANLGYTFNGLNSATINGQAATVTYNSGSALSLSFTFPKTEYAEVEIVTNRYVANTMPVTDTNRVKYSYTYNGYDYYYLYLGRMTNIPLFSFAAEEHNGIPHTISMTIKEETINNISSTVSKSNQEAVKRVEENTRENTFSASISTDLKASYGGLFFSAEAKLHAETNWKEYVKQVTSNTYEYTTSITNTEQHATSYATAHIRTSTLDLTADNPKGFYRYSMFAASDAYLIINRDPIANKTYYEFRECVLPDDGNYTWKWEYSEIDSFPKNDNTSFLIDISILDNLPKTEWDLGFFSAETKDEWNRAVDLIKNAGSGTAVKPKEYTISISGNVALPGSTTNTFGSTANMAVTLNGSGKLYLNSQGSLLNIAANQTLIIDSSALTLQGFKAGQDGALQNNNRTIISVNAGKFELKNGTISGNITTTNAGGVHIMNGGTFAMSGGIISDNEAIKGSTGGISYGGGVYVDSGTFTLSGGNKKKNKAVYCGGVEIVNSPFTMSDGVIQGNTASGDIGGVDINNSVFNLAGGIIENNKAYNFVGGVRISSNSTLTMNGGTIRGNTATVGVGGGVFVSGKFTMNGGIIGSDEKSKGNKAVNGGGVYITGGAFTMVNGTIKGNTANDSGGGVWVDNGTFTMTGGLMDGNEATKLWGGGVIVMYDQNGIFKKTGGTITGINDPNGNRTMSKNNGGHAAYVYTIGRRRENTAGPNDNLDSSGSGSSYGWI